LGVINENITLYAQWKPIYQPLTVLHRFDEGFQRRFNNARNIIEEYQDEVSKILVNVFDLIVETHSIARYTSVSDACKKQTGALTIARLSSLCDCDDDENKCILNYRVRDDLNAQFPIVNTAITDYCTINKTRYSWSGHLLLEEADKIARPMWWGYSGITVMTSYRIDNGSATFLDTLSSEVRDLRFIYLLLHELAHQVDANDHYCYKDGAPCSNKHCYLCRDRTLIDCVMNWQSGVITDRLREEELWNDLFCKDDCEFRIVQFLNGHFKR
jgi:hypothetical protein